MSLSADQSRTTYFDTPQPFLDIVEPLGLEVPRLGVNDYFALRLLRNGRTLDPNWAGLVDASRALELEEPLGITYGLDPRDDDADPEIELADASTLTMWNYHQHRFTTELSVHIDPSPTNKEASWKQANIATWMAMLIGKDLQSEGGLDAMLERFKSEKNKKAIASAVGQIGVVGGNLLVQGAALGTALHVASWAGYGVGVAGATIYRHRLNKQLKEVRGDKAAIIRLTDEDYTEEAAALFAEHSALIDYKFEDTTL